MGLVDHLVTVRFKDLGMDHCREVDEYGKMGAGDGPRMKVLENVLPGGVLGYLPWCKFLSFIFFNYFENVVTLILLMYQWWTFVLCFKLVF